MEIAQKLEHFCMPERTANKVVQLEIEGEPYMVFGEVNSYHKIILAEALKQVGIPFSYLDSETKMPELEGEGYKATGMGFATVLGNTVLLARNSFDYGIGIDVAGINKLKPYLPERIELIVSKYS